MKFFQICYNRVHYARCMFPLISLDGSPGRQVARRWNQTVNKGTLSYNTQCSKKLKIVQFTEKSICLLLSQKDKIIDIFCEIFFQILKYYLLLGMVLIFELLHDCTIFSEDLVPKQLTTRVATQRRLFDMIIWHFVDWFAKIRAQYFYFSCFWKLLILKYLLLFYIWTIIA